MLKFFLTLFPCFGLSVLLQAAPVINEIHYNNEDNTVCNEFVELYNPDSSAVDLGGWQLTGAIEFTFPAGSTLPASGYLVIGEDPATLTSEFGITALGPYSGRLNSEGEKLELVDSSGSLVDEVDYGVGFPWPSLAAGDGSSMELINPNLDNDLGSSWRSSGVLSESPAQDLIEQQSTWRYRRGLNEASDPIHAWTALDFVEDATWFDGQTPIGYGEPLVETLIADMAGNYSSLFLRREFTFNGSPPDTLNLRALFDDGIIIWLNGSEIFRSDSVASGIINYRGNDANNAGNPNHGVSITNHEQNGYEEFTLSGVAELLQSGSNVLAIQALNTSLTSSDLIVDISLAVPPPFFSQSAPTPGQQNDAYSPVAPPNIRQVRHLPESPTSADPVTVTARVTDPDGVAEVTLSYQQVLPGNYVRRSDPSYEDGWVELPMADLANTGTYSATLPAAGHRDLIRYRISCVDANGVGVSTPFSDDSQPNFAYFVYDGVPSWSGANQPGVDAPTTFPSAVLEELPTYHLIANATDVNNSQFVPAFNNVRFLGTLVYDGEVYDHIEFEVGGRGSTYLNGKNKWRMAFNPARDLEVRDNFGERYGETWNRLTMNPCGSTRNAGNRGMAGMDESLSFKIHQLTGAVAPNTSYLHFRVIDSAVETSPTDQYEGDLWGLYLAIEEIGGGLLDERDLPDGNLYRIEGNEREHQAKGQASDRSDWTTFTSLSNNTNTETWWRENLDLERYFNFRASNRITGNIDLRFGGNHFFYHGSNADGTESRWAPIAWDLDMMLSSVRHWSGTVRQENCLQHPAIEIEFQNRCREILDLLLDDATDEGGQIGQLIDEFTQILNPTGQPLTWADVDQHLWNFNPLSNSDERPRFDHFGNFFASPVTLTRREGTWTRTIESPDFEGQMTFIRNYMTDTDPDPSTWSVNSGDQRGYGYNFLTSEAFDPDIPNTPVITYDGPSGFPTNGLSFQSSDFSDPQGAATAAAIEWRIGAISSTSGEPGVFEIQENWTTGQESPAFALTVTAPATAVTVGDTFRARVRHQDTTGRWSHWSEPLEFVAGVPDASVLEQNLVISEIMYNPSTGQEHEYIELHNIGDSTLDLTGVRFADGITFDFPAGTEIAAGEYALVVRDLTAFEAFYGTGLPVVGSYGESDSGSLSNGGEEVTLALGSSPIHTFEYDDRSPWPLDSDGNGSALVLYNISDNATAVPSDPLGHGIASNWRQGIIGGTPGTGEPSNLFIGDPEADDDNDGLPALLEHALGSSDTTPNIENLCLHLDDGQITLTFSRNPLASDIRFTVEVSSDLTTWIAGGILESQDASSATYLFEPDGDRLFVRLLIEQVTSLQN